MFAKLKLPGAIVAMAFDCGVTRLADITGLDKIGLPVFQAFRPMSRALSVHQGKGLTATRAAIGALMEAIESAIAERFVGASLLASFEDLPATERTPELGDFARWREDAMLPTERLEWVPGERILGKDRVWAPLDWVSLDSTRSANFRLDRSSNGLGAHLTAEDAAMKGLLEVIERDATAAWFALPLHARIDSVIEPSSIPLDWFQNIRKRASERGIELAVYCIPGVVDLPVMVAEVREPRAGPSLRRHCYGSACALNADEALLGAVAEAFQSRLTVISGARDDLVYAMLPTNTFIGFGLAYPPPSNIRPRVWPEFTEPFHPGKAHSIIDVAGMLGELGYPDAMTIPLTLDGGDVQVIKTFIPGLGLKRRTRRAAIA